MRFRKLATLLFGAALAGSATVATAAEKEATQNARDARTEKIQSATENAPLYFSEAQLTPSLSTSQCHSSHYSHSSHSSHFSHRSGY